MSRRTPVLDVYEAMKLIAADRTDTPPCGMFAWESNDQVDFWALTRAGSEVSVSLARELGADQISLHRSLASRGVVQRAADSGMPVTIWTADDPRWIDQCRKSARSVLPCVTRFVSAV